MATFTPTLSIKTTSLTSNDLDFSVTTSPTVTDTTGLQRTTLTSTSKVTKLAVLDGDADVADVSATVEGKYVDITDNHGLKKRYVFTDAGASGAADGTIIVSDTDIGSTSSPDSSLIGGICVQVADGDEQRDLLEQLRAVVNHANGHNGSITAAAVASEADGPQSSTFTNPTTGESGVFIIDAANATWTHIDNTGDADATNSGADHPTIVDKNEFASPAFLYVIKSLSYNQELIPITFVFSL